MIKKVVFPVAGLGTRFLPVTKSIPKEMLPIVDKPLIQYAVEEALEAGAETLIFVTGKGKRSIEDYFDRDLALEEKLKRKNEKGLLEAIRDIIPAGVNCVYLRQFEPAGLGHAVLCAAPVINDEAFGVVLADDLVYSQGKKVLSQLADLHKQYKSSVVAVEEVAREDVSKYGIIDGKRIDDRTWQLTSVVEKPAPADASSNMAIIGRYILTSDIFDILSSTSRGAGDEIQLTDALNMQMHNGSSQTLAYRFSGERFDCGYRLGYMKANIRMSLETPDIGEILKEYLKNKAGF